VPRLQEEEVRSNLWSVLEYGTPLILCRQDPEYLHSQGYDHHKPILSNKRMKTRYRTFPMLQFHIFYPWSFTIIAPLRCILLLFVFHAQPLYGLDVNCVRTISEISSGFSGLPDIIEDDLLRSGNAVSKETFCRSDNIALLSFYCALSSTTFKLKNRIKSLTFLSKSGSNESLCIDLWGLYRTASWNLCIWLDERIALTFDFSSQLKPTFGLR